MKDNQLLKQIKQKDKNNYSNKYTDRK